MSSIFRRILRKPNLSFRTISLYFPHRAGQSNSKGLAKWFIVTDTGATQDVLLFIFTRLLHRYPAESSLISSEIIRYINTVSLSDHLNEKHLLSFPTQKKCMVIMIYRVRLALPSEYYYSPRIRIICYFWIKNACFLAIFADKTKLMTIIILSSIW